MSRSLGMKNQAEEDDSCRFHCCDFDIVDEYCLTCGMFFKACRSPLRPYSCVDLALCRPRTNEGAMMQCGFFLIYAIAVGCAFIEVFLLYAVSQIFQAIPNSPHGYGWHHAFILVYILFLLISVPMTALSYYFNIHAMWFANAVKHGCVLCAGCCCCGTGQIWIAIMCGLTFLDIGSHISEIETLREFSPSDSSQQTQQDLNQFPLITNPTAWMCVIAFFVVLELYYATYVCKFFCDVRNGNVITGAKRLVGEAVHVTLDDVFEEETESETENGLIA